MTEKIPFFVQVKFEYYSLFAVAVDGKPSFVDLTLNLSEFVFADAAVDFALDE